MSVQQVPLTYERILKLFRKTREQFRETREQFRETREQFRETCEQMKESDRKYQEQMKESDRKYREQMKESDRKYQEQMKESDRKLQEQMKKTDRKISALGSRIGEIVANMVKGNIVKKFQALGYDGIDDLYENRKFNNKKLGIHGEIDLILENGEIAILIEVKTTLETADVRKHIERLEKYRRHIDAKGSGDKRCFIGAVAGAVVRDEAAEFAQENGLYVIVQSGRAVEILTPPEGFTAKKW